MLWQVFLDSAFGIAATYINTSIGPSFHLRVHGLFSFTYHFIYNLLLYFFYFCILFPIRQFYLLFFYLFKIELSYAFVAFLNCFSPFLFAFAHKSVCSVPSLYLFHMAVRKIDIIILNVFSLLGFLWTDSIHNTVIACEDQKRHVRLAFRVLLSLLLFRLLCHHLLYTLDTPQSKHNFIFKCPIFQ